MQRIILSLPIAGLLVGSIGLQAAETDSSRPLLQPLTSRVISLDGDMWRLATDPQNEGREHDWYRAARPEAKPAKVPWIIQDIFPGYHGVAWYWRTFDAPPNPHLEGRCLLRFWGVDYLAEVWLNDLRIGRHEGGESPFTLDVTDAIRRGGPNVLAVRVLNPTHTPIDGIVLGETAHRNKAMPYQSGSAWNQGGIIDSVELLLVPAVRIDDLFVRPDCDNGQAARPGANQPHRQWTDTRPRRVDGRAGRQWDHAVQPYHVTWICPPAPRRSTPTCRWTNPVSGNSTTRSCIASRSGCKWRGPRRSTKHPSAVASAIFALPTTTSASMAAGSFCVRRTRGIAVPSAWKCPTIQTYCAVICCT